MKKSIYQRVGFAKPTATIGALAAAISACYAPQTFAAEAGARQLDEVVVTARRRDEMAQDVPIAMTVMTSDYLENNNIENIQDIGTKVPSMRITSLGGSMNEPIVSLRGQRQGESSFNQDPVAPMYFNEIVIAPTQGSNLGLYDLESLQVLKGPQGTLFGRNSTGGAVLITPKRPGHELGGYLEVKAGDYNLFGFEGAIDVPIYDKLTTRIAAHKLDRDGYQENIADNALHGRDYRDEHSSGGRISVNFEQNAFSSLTVLAYDENNISAGIPVNFVANAQAGLGGNSGLQAGSADQIARDDPFKIKSDVNAKENVRNVFASNTSEFEINDNLTVKNVFGYRQVHFATATDIDGTESALFGTPTVGVFGTPTQYAVTFNPTPSTVDTEFYSDELQLFGSALDNKLDWLTGLYWSKMQGTEDKLVQTSPFSPAVGVRPARPAGIDNGINDIVNTSYGIMGESTYAFTDEWSLTAGLRQSWDEREYTTQKWTSLTESQATCNLYAEGTVPAQGIKAPGCERSVSKSFNKPTWKLSLNYKPETTSLVYGSVATGYRAGGFNTRGNEDANLKPFAQESVVTYELGHKKDWDFSGVTVRTSVAAYVQNYEDIQNTSSFAEPDGRLVTKTENAGKAQISGLEFETTVKPIDSLRFDFSYSYVNAKYIKRESLIRGNTVDTSGDDFPYVPMQSLTASTTYTLPLDAKIGEVSVTAGAYWQDEMQTNTLIKEFDRYQTGANPLLGEQNWSTANVAAMQKVSTVDAYTVYNLRADWKAIMGSRFDAAVYVNNVTDEQYVLGGLNVLDTGGYGAYNYGDPRTIGASAKYSF